MPFLKFIVRCVLFAPVLVFAELTAPQSEHLHIIVDWMQEHDGRPPEPHDFGKAPHQIPIPYDRLLGKGLYRQGGAREHLQIFSDPQAYWRALKHYAESRGLKLSLLNIRFSCSLAPETRSVLQQEAVDRIIEWMKKAGRTQIRSSDFAKDKIPINYARLIASGNYKRGAVSYESRIFDFRWDLDEALKQRLQDAPKHPPPAPPKEVTPDEAVDLVLKWIQTNGRTPAPAEFQLYFPFTYEKLVGVNLFEGAGIFQTPDLFWLSLYEKRGEIRVSLLEVPFKTLSFELRGVLRLQAMERVLDWITDHEGRIPRFNDFGIGEDKIGVHYHRLMGTSDYAPGEALHPLALFENTQHFWLQLHAYARKRGIRISLLDVQFRGELSDELKAHLQEEALERTIEWMKDPRLGGGRRPTEREMFTRKRGLRVVHGRLFAPARAQKEGLNTGRVFASFEEFDRLLAERWEEQRHNVCEALIQDNQT